VLEGVFMKTLTIRNIPDDLYKTITRVAQRNRRSIQQQVLVILDKARVYDNESPVDKAMAIRQALMDRDLGNTINEIHVERNR
jgi:plasmid stability protein